MPDWTRVLATISVAIGVVCALMVGLDLSRRPQHMRIMNVVWPVTALWSGPLGLWAYYRYGRLASRACFAEAQERGESPPSEQLPMPVHVAKGATHCGSGCTLGDIAAELLVLVAPLSILGHRIFGAWIYDFAFAFAFGIAFQYLTIKPMQNLSVKQGLWAALKADALSLTAWQIGMYGWMAVATFVLFRRELPKGSPVFWFMMQIAMLCGFFTAYPVNWWLIRRGVKERM